MLIIDEDHFRYLVIQHGAVSEHRKDFEAWQRAYERSLENTMEGIRPALPEKCSSVLDVGSGLGGIDVLLSRAYHGLAVRLFDGLADPPEVASHCKTFNHMAVAMDFLKQNDVADRDYYTPERPPLGTYDLIVSFSAYGFHIRPGDYMDMVRGACHRGTVLILDVRIARPDWLKELCDALGKPQVLDRARKYARLSWVVS